MQQQEGRGTKTGGMSPLFAFLSSVFRQLTLCSTSLPTSLRRIFAHSVASRFPSLLHSLLLYLFFSLCFSFFFLLSSKGPRENCVRENCKRGRDKYESIHLARIFSALPACGCQKQTGHKRDAKSTRCVCGKARKVRGRAP